MAAFARLRRRGRCPAQAGGLSAGHHAVPVRFEARNERPLPDASKRVPIFIAHGHDDKVIPWVNQEVFFKKVKAAAPDYPIKMTLFVGGAHGTPMRMIDWRLELNWVLRAGRG